ncbi:hypothetical protein EZS27_002054 [termite gut metagenome]|uniref:DNA replication and repair protein RecF n=1 Tax=termite gut metagenome TaxID=433724 RepID=A0A5J4SYL3_9ZZZZ
MITKLSLEKFKCFDKKQDFQLSKLNLFTGLNGRGKSTVFQSLLLLSQSLIEKGNIEELFVNGNFIQLGLFEDIVFSLGESKNKIVKFYIDTDEEDVQAVELGYKESLERIGKISNMKINKIDYFQTSTSIQHTGKIIGERRLSAYPKETINKLFKDYYFISADRLGPTLYEEKGNKYDFNPVGILGEHRLNVLAEDRVTNSLLFDENSGTLLEEVNKWLNYIMDGVSLEIHGVEKEISVLYLLLNNPRNKIKIKAVNSGYGYSYILSIIITALIAEKGNVVFIENPEAHLHPRAQARLTEMLCKLTMIGVQVFVETHSEHIINGTRLFYLKHKEVFSYEDISMYFFGEDFNVEKLEMDSDAQIANWPTGFFDQQEIDLAEILSLGLFK